MSDFKGLFAIRPMASADTNFVIATFLRGVYYGETWLSETPKEIFMDNYKKVAENLLNNPNVAVTVACLPDDPNVILGYSILSSDAQVVHWVYVKSIWRKKGIGKTLVPAHPAAVSHLTALGRILLPKLNGAIFNPFTY